MISIYTLTSPLHDAQRIDILTQEFLASLHIEYTFRGADFSAYGKDGLDLIYVRTGGTEGIFRQLLPTLRQDRPFFLLTSGRSNSLAASMEILSYLNQKGLRGEILHGSIEWVHDRINVLERTLLAFQALHGQRLGIIGAPSDWLISSGCDREKVWEKMGIEIVDLPIERLIANFEKTDVDPAAVDTLLKVPCREGMEEKVRTALPDAERIYRALKTLVEEEHLSGLTLRCFELLSTLGNTGCLALARLNSEGIVATCEGDIPAMLTMVIARSIAGQSGFQCNPSRLDPVTREMYLAHCTLPLSMAKTYNFDTHFESGIGVGIHGELPTGPVTLFKLSGSLDRCFIERADLVRNAYSTNLCRTQVIIRLQEGSQSIPEYFLRKPIGNHHVLLTGDHTVVLRSLMHLLDI